MRVLKEHPLRRLLQAEIHARPTLPMKVPIALSYLVCLDAEGDGFADLSYVEKLSRTAPPGRLDNSENYHVIELDGGRMVWEKHTEFARYTLIKDQATRHDAALDLVSDDWISQLPGEVIFAAHCQVVSGGAGNDVAQAEEIFGQGVFAGSRIAEGDAAVFTDFENRQDQFNRLLIVDHGSPETQMGRNVQRLLEINTYWLLALLALPEARALSPFLTNKEAGVENLSKALLGAMDPERENLLLNELSQLEAEVSSRAAENSFRFAASAAYYELVVQRIKDLREIRIPGLQTIDEFSQRRLAPAMSTASSATERQNTLIDRTARLTRVLATRVELNMQQQNSDVLRAMDQRVRLQLRLQQTVEGLSIAAITYYVVGLINYAADLWPAGLLGISSMMITVVSIPAVALLVGFGVWRARRRLEKENPDTRLKL